MRRAVFRAMLLNLVRDRGALVMAFVLPALFFVIFAVIFAGASGGDLAIKVAVADEQGTEVSARFVAGLETHSQIVILEASDGTAREVRSLVRDGIADVGLIVRADSRALDDLQGEGTPPIEVVGDPTREIPVSVVEGAVQEVFFSELSDVVSAAARDMALSGLPPEIRQAAEAGAAGDSDDAEGGGLHLNSLTERRDAVTASGADTSISYYAGAVAAMFLLFSSLTASMTYLSEKESGLLDRIAAGPSGLGAVVDGKFLFLVLQGTIQVTIIFLVAWVFFEVDLPGNIAPWAVTTVVATMCAAALTLMFVVVCQTQTQAQTLGTIVALVVSALGGSMVPRFLMPGWIQDIGWITPNAWVLDAYGAILWRGEGWDSFVMPWSVLLAVATTALLAARLIAAYKD